MIHDTDKIFHVPMSTADHESSAWQDEVPSLDSQRRTLAFLEAKQRDKDAEARLNEEMERNRKASLIRRREHREASKALSNFKKAANDFHEFNVRRKSEAARPRKLVNGLSFAAGLFGSYAAIEFYERLIDVPRLHYDFWLVSAALAAGCIVIACIVQARVQGKYEGDR